MESICKYFLLLLLLLFNIEFLQSQVIEANPEYPGINDSVDITFYTDRCDCPLDGYTGDIYAHTGVLTFESTGSSDWKYVIADWNQNLEKAKLEKVNATTYMLHIRPSISEYYNIPENVSVEKLAFVFRTPDGSKKTIDLFYDVQDEGLNLQFIKPSADTVVQAEAEITIEVAAIRLNTPPTDSIMLYIDSMLIQTAYDSVLTYTHTAETEGMHWIRIVADNPDYSISDSLFYFIREELTIADLPAGIGNGVNIIDDQTVTAVLYAPYKDHVFLIGDFNNWQLNNEYLMNRTPDGNNYWLTLNNLTPGEEYAYQYLIDGSIRVADAYTEKVLDPVNDEFIPEDTYPDLKEYPEGKTSGLVSVFQTSQTSYVWQNGTFTPPVVTDLVIYELHVQNYTSTGNIKTITDTLDYLAKLGVNAVELMPVNEFEGNYSWGYNPSFYFALDKMYGTKNDFKAFVDACHARGIAVIIDMVLNHSYRQSPLLTMYWNNESDLPAADNPWYNEKHNFVDNTSAHWGYDFNHESQATQNLVDSINSYWMAEYRIDGFRFDFTKGFSNTQWYGSDNWASAYDADRIAILKRMTDEIWVRNPHAFVIFEHLADNTEEKELAEYGILLWGNMNYNYNEATMGYNESGKSNLTWGVYTSRGWSEPHLVSYMESHDEERMMFKNLTWGNSNESYDIKEKPTALLRMETAAAFFFMIPGPKMVWQWGELGYQYSINRCTDGTIDPSCRLALKPEGWELYEDPYNYRLYRVFSELIKLRTENNLFETTDFTTDVSGTLKRIHLNSSEMNAAILGNFDLVEREIDPGFQHSGTWYDYLTGESIEVSDLNTNITLAPGANRIFTDVKLETPDMPTSLSTGSVVHQRNTAYLYPNPARDILSIVTPLSDEIQFMIYDLSGQMVCSYHYNVNPNEATEIRLNLNQGIYIYRILTPESSMQGKLVIE
jgi:hypothetical protein